MVSFAGWFTAIFAMMVGGWLFHVEEMTDPMTGFFLLMGLAVGGYVMGWLSFRRPP